MQARAIFKSKWVGDMVLGDVIAVGRDGKVHKAGIVANSNKAAFEQASDFIERVGALPSSSTPTMLRAATIPSVVSVNDSAPRFNT
jgi:hypothetical protein